MMAHKRGVLGSRVSDGSEFGDSNLCRAGGEGRPCIFCSNVLMSGQGRPELCVQGIMLLAVKCDRPPSGSDEEGQGRARRPQQSKSVGQKRALNNGMAA